MRCQQQHPIYILITVERFLPQDMANQNYASSHFSSAPYRYPSHCAFGDAIAFTDTIFYKHRNGRLIAGAVVVLHSFSKKMGFNSHLYIIVTYDGFDR